ncbi:MAG: UDP-N-acetylmuramoyl-tripeptide--D-alanyl-D-alanine ligase, partial [Anaerolineae bacterium]|nr:UDP-N-acetylmuramoyl-tripeptide--D-alanyl-D-alanine ligase [Anaerolineae bacterium]
GRLPSGVAPDVEIRSSVIDSRLVSPGALFVALKGERCDGNDFVVEAIEKGAVAVIAERAPDTRCTVLAVGEMAAPAAADAAEWERGLPVCFI